VESSSIKSSKSNGSEKVFCRFGPNSTGSFVKKKRELIIDAMKEKWKKRYF
jgi:hypothetical protein